MIRLTTRGFGLLSVGIVLLAVAGATGLRSLAWPGGLLIGVVAVSVVVAGLSARRTVLRRRLLPDRLPAGASVRVSLELERTSIGVGSWSVVEELVPPELTGAPVLAVRSGWGRLRSAHQYQLGTHVRGRYRVGPSVWSTTDPLALAVTRRRMGTSCLVTVTPAIHPLGAAGRDAGAGLTGDSAQLRSSSLLGADDTLIRDYRPRDEMRRIHWPSTARTGTLMVRREEHAFEPSALILLDNRAGAHTGRGAASSLEWAVSAVASIGVFLLDAGYDVDLADAGGRTLAAEGDSVREALLDHLTDIDETQTDDLIGAIAAGGAAKGQLLVAVLGRLSDADALALTTARRDGRACRAIILHPGDPSGTDPAESLVASGWQVVRDAAGLGVAQAWAGLDWGARR